MAATHFNYTDYLLFAAAKNVNPTLYSTAAHGVIGMLKSQFYLYTEPETITSNLFLETGLIFDLPAEPVTTLNSITYDGTVIDDTTYSWYGREVLMTSALADYRKPLVLSLDVGYVEIPTDLKLAVYRHIDAVIFAINKDTDSIDKVTNSTGNTTYYRDTLIPLSVLSVYEFYSVRPQVLS